MKVIIATHGPLAGALKESAAMFFAEKSEELCTVSLYPEDSPDDLLENLKSIVDKNPNEEYLCLVDIFAGTPFNMVALLIEEYPETNIQCITGVNMPLLLEVMANFETESLEELMKLVENIGEESVINLRKTLEI